MQPCHHQLQIIAPTLVDGCAKFRIAAQLWKLMHSNVVCLKSVDNTDLKPRLEDFYIEFSTFGGDTTRVDPMHYCMMTTAVGLSLYLPWQEGNSSNAVHIIPRTPGLSVANLCLELVLSSAQCSPRPLALHRTILSLPLSSPYCKRNVAIAFTVLPTAVIFQDSEGKIAREDTIRTEWIPMRNLNQMPGNNRVGILEIPVGLDVSTPRMIASFSEEAKMQQVPIYDLDDERDVEELRTHNPARTMSEEKSAFVIKHIAPLSDVLITLIASLGATAYPACASAISTCKYLWVGCEFDGLNPPLLQ
jgi:hypothetical protein